MQLILIVDQSLQTKITCLSSTMIYVSLNWQKLKIFIKSKANRLDFLF